jgi:hypothetical protein
MFPESPIVKPDQMMGVIAKADVPYSAFIKVSLARRI